jgi:hypothetical protein
MKRTNNIRCIQCLLSLPPERKRNLRRTRQGAAPLARLPLVALDRAFAVSTKPPLWEAKEEISVIQRPSSQRSQHVSPIPAL